ncbi:MAG: alanine racemase [Alphaproteobacteria bacterium]|nr:MAG: alanine racemase [Alphaproteobacteria bacterium]
MAGMTDSPRSQIRFPGAELEIDLDAIERNYQRFVRTLGAAECGATVKADAYGLGVAHVAPVLWDAGCRTFFVATPAEGIELRDILPEATIYIFNGAPRDWEYHFIESRLIPVLNSLSDISAWATFARAMGATPAPAALHFDSGMNRLGLSAAEVETLVAEPHRAPFDIPCVMSHLACADKPDEDMTARQRDRFAAAAEAFIEARCDAGLGDDRPRLSLANSAGILIDESYHFDLARPGIGLYGGNPFTDRPSPVDNVIRLRGRILQIREVSPPDTVGYGATHEVTGPGRIATVDVGYGDGYLRCFGEGNGWAVINGHRVPVAGRVSMDSHALDITALPLDDCGVGTMVDLLGGPVPLDDVVKTTGLSGYELLTLLGHRYNRVYKKT